jgi:hypothetical protein
MAINLYHMWQDYYNDSFNIKFYSLSKDKTIKSYFNLTGIKSCFSSADNESDFSLTLHYSHSEQIEFNHEKISVNEKKFLLL